MASVNALAARSMLFFVQLRRRNKKALKAKECCEDRFNLGGRCCVDTIPLASPRAYVARIGHSRMAYRPQIEVLHVQMRSRGWVANPKAQHLELGVEQACSTCVENLPPVSTEAR